MKRIDRAIDERIRLPGNIRGERVLVVTRCLMVLIFLALGDMGCASGGGITDGNTVVRFGVAVHVFYVPGVSGHTEADDHLVKGLRDAGFAGTITIDNWTGENPSLGVLHDRRRHRNAAVRLAQQIEVQRKAQPDAPIVLIAHSAGTGIAIWALESLPEGMQVDSTFLLSPALSPTYDLSVALRHVSARTRAFVSDRDGLVLGVGTTLFGTIDGVYTGAAGLHGFVQPATADPQAYRNLINCRYQPAWVQFGDNGGHCGNLSDEFGANVLAPLLRQ